MHKSRLIFFQQPKASVSTVSLLHIHVARACYITAGCTQCQHGIAIVSCPSVRLSVSLSVCDIQVGVDQFEINYTKKLAQGLRSSEPQHCQSSPKKQPKIRVEQGWGRSSQETCNIYEKGQDRTKVTVDNRIHAFDWCQNQRPWMTLKGHYTLSFKTRAFFGAHYEHLNEDRLYCQRRRCSPNLMTLDSDNIVYANRNGSQDLCKFSLDFMPASLYYVYRKRHGQMDGRLTIAISRQHYVHRAIKIRN